MNVINYRARKWFLLPRKVKNMNTPLIFEQSYGHDVTIQLKFNKRKNSL